jgi:hypothetical protein
MYSVIIVWLAEIVWVYCALADILLQYLDRCCFFLKSLPWV